MKKITCSLTEEQEAEAVAVWDSQGDQFPLTAEQIQADGHYLDGENLFYFVFGYAHAKGWTSMEKRMAARF